MKVGDADWRVQMDKIEAALRAREAVAYEIALAVLHGNLDHAQRIVPDFAVKDAELERLRQEKDERMDQSA